jgi:hypothetical protein
MPRREQPEKRAGATAESARSYDLTRDGFTLLVMGWTGEPGRKPKRTRAQSIMAAPWTTDRARGREMGGRLLLQRGRHPVVPASRSGGSRKRASGLG